MKKVKYLLLPLLFFSLISCNVSGSNSRSSEMSTTYSQEITLKKVYEIGYHHNVNGESYYYSWYVDTNNGSLVIYDNYENKNFLVIHYAHYNIVYRRANEYYKGYLYDYGEYYILVIGE